MTVELSELRTYSHYPAIKQVPSVPSQGKSVITVMSGKTDPQEDDDDDDEEEEEEEEPQGLPALAPNFSIMTAELDLLCEAFDDGSDGAEGDGVSELEPLQMGHPLMVAMQKGVARN